MTVDFDGEIAIRARGSTNTATTELVVSRSSYTGTAVQFGADRDFVTRALRLRLGEVEVIDPKSPIVCRSGQSTYAWQPLDSDSVIDPGEDVTRIESDLGPPTTPQHSPESPPWTTCPMTTNASLEPESPRSSATAATIAPPDVAHYSAANGLVALIREAESLHETLGDARAQTLIVALERQRKQARLVTATLNSLRQLKPQEVAG